MKKTALLFSFLIAVTFQVIAQTSVWKVEGNGNTLYIGGTVHILRTTDYPLPEKFDEAYSSSDMLVLEADVKEMENPQNANKLIAKGIYSDGRLLKNVLDDDVFNQLEAKCNELGLSLANLSNFKPSLIIMTLTALELQKLGINTPGVDVHYMTKAGEDNKQLGFLETVEEQLNIIGTMGEGNENEFVKYSLEDNENMFDQYVALIEDWKAGSGKTITKMIEDTDKSYPEMYEELLVNRNKKWLPKIETYLADDTTEFILFGSAHLWGKEGVLKLLKDKGYKVTQLQ